MVSTLAKGNFERLVSSRAAEHLRSFRKDIERLFPERVSKVVLFGSRARGDSRHDSDYDVAVFVKNLADRRSVDHALADAAYKHVLAGIHIRPISVPSSYLEKPSEGLLALHIARDGVLIT